MNELQTQIVAEITGLQAALSVVAARLAAVSGEGDALLARMHEEAQKGLDATRIKFPEGTNETAIRARAAHLIDRIFAGYQVRPTQPPDGPGED